MGSLLAPEQTYIYCGDGLGVPGLPHTLTGAEAEQLGLAELLQTALETGTHKPAEA